ncbi:hypothetical protein EY643_09775 [Halioglobus maricola]|uniref:Wadjet protein JetD C-terminal domain-containing protein n=1 Tax=Halioglobus maricola TaxID=2601894 RepID=A0A5P9NK78_9GAMM|nr:hypothetical protein [Halioglobus maricola]QFU75925.1 hypothetical protein EY643_09775 [Halioglobus maricola]
MSLVPPADAPIWVSDYEDINRLLSSFLDKADTGTRLLIRLTPKSTPSLFEYNSEDAPVVWSLIQKLEADFGILEIEPDRAETGKEVYENAKVRFNSDHEETVRQWLNRPKKLPYKDEWQQAASSMQWSHATARQFIGVNPLQYPNKGAQEILNQLLSLEVALSIPATLRSLSARHFWGDSKYLDNKEEYLVSAFPHRSDKVIPRPILVNVYIPEEFSSVLFIENQDSFQMMADYLFRLENSQIAIVYTAGFRGSASRIRDAGGYSISQMHPASDRTLQRFIAWWEKHSEEDIACSFWGDLDYSGLAILAALHGIFTSITGWKPAYDLMRQQLRAGNAHPISSGSKGTQVDPGTTGCFYADQVLLPDIRENNLFVDQEIVNVTELEEYLQQVN